MLGQSFRHSLSDDGDGCLRSTDFFIDPGLVLQQFNQPFHWTRYRCHSFYLKWNLRRARSIQKIFALSLIHFETKLQQLPALFMEGNRSQTNPEAVDE